MIISRYVIKETLKTQAAILFVLLLIFFSQKLVQILASAVDGNIPSNLIFSLLMLGVAEMGQLILPLSLFLAILIAFGRLYLESEMVAMFACGVKRHFLYRVVFLLSLVTCALAVANSSWFTPWSNAQQEQLIENAKVNPGLAGLLAGQFQRSPKGDAVLYLGQVEDNQINNVFIAQLNPPKSQRPSIILASKGKVMLDPDGNQIISLDTAKRYEGTALLRDFRISQFKDYQAIIVPKTVIQSQDEINEQVDQLNMVQLAKLHTLKARSEFNWRLTLIICIPLLAFLVIPLSAINPRQGKMANFLPAILLYLSFFLIQSSLKSAGLKGRFDPVLGIWLVNFGYLLLAIILNSWDTLWMRQLRAKLRRRSA